MRYLLFILSIAILSCNKKEEKIIDPVVVTDSVAVEKVSTKMQIVPGQSIGNISLLQNAETLETILGKPDLSDAAMGKAWLTWFSKVSDTVTGNELNIYTTYKDQEMSEKVVRQVRITSDEFKTPDGMATGKSLSEIQQFYPNLELVGVYDHETSTPISVYDDSGSGIAFEFENNICSGIIIHEKGEKVTDQYLSFHPDMKPM